MRNLILLVALCISTMTQSQNDHRISTVSFVQILNDNRTEAVFYFQNNWKVLREMAIKKNYIDSYQVLETPFTDTEPFHLILMTTYTNEEQYQLREKHFTELIEEKGALKLMNKKKPEEFRKTLFTKEKVRYLDF